MFDTHFIIRQFIRRYSDEYGKFFKSKTLSTHGRIGKEIKKFEGLLVEQQKLKSYSENIHQKGSKCTLWKKL